MKKQTTLRRWTIRVFGTLALLIRSAIGVAVAADGSVFATDFLNARVEKWRAF